MTTAFVLSGGGSLGAVQVGMVAALSEADIHPDVLVGTSVGALNAAWLAGHGTDAASVDALGRLWVGIRRSDVFPFDPIRQVLALQGRRSSLCSPDGLGRLVADHLAFGLIEDAAIPLHVVTTDLLSGLEHVISAGDPLSAVLASAAIPAVFPPVEREGHVLVDGGLANNTAISHAVALGADRVIVLPTGFACALAAAPTSSLATATQALTILVEQRLIVDIARFAPQVDLAVLPPLCPLSVSPTDFGHSALLISQAHEQATTWISAGGLERTNPERFLSLHHHRIAHLDDDLAA